MRVTATLLVLISLLSFVGRFGVIISFKLNQEYIAKNLCENRFDESSTCKGKCYLKKQLQKQDTEESKSSHSHGYSRIEDFTLHQHDRISCSRTFITTDPNHTSFILLRKTIDYNNSVFHPPSIKFL